MDAIWSALVDPRRRAVLELLRDRDRTVGELADRLGAAQPATSKHLKVLREAGLVRSRVDAQRRVYAIDPEPMAALDAWLAPYRRLWNARLDALGRHLDADTTEESADTEHPADAGPRDRPGPAPHDPPDTAPPAAAAKEE